jgi:hypothetical protein
MTNNRHEKDNLKLFSFVQDPKVEPPPKVETPEVFNKNIDPTPIRMDQRNDISQITPSNK